MADELKGKIAIITGGAAGIGRGAVELFVKEGAKVVIADIQDEKGEAVAARLGPAAVFKHTDVSKSDQVKELIDFTAGHFGGLHVMFNNAGISSPTAERFIDEDLEKDFHAVMETNVLGVMLGSQYAARHIVKHGGGSIINTTSISAYLSGYAFLVYRASKAAVLEFSKSIAIDLGEHNVRVNMIAPAHIRSEMTSFSAPDLSQEEIDRVEEALSPVWMSNQLIKRRGMPEDIAHAAMFLASDRATYITGVQLPVDAGVTTGDPVNHLREFNAARAKALNALKA